jgi:pimeloyl-ACP methyl ester carboxylesterase
MMAALEWGPEDRPIDLVFSHANGFNARTYQQLLGPLANAYRVLALDARGHGSTIMPTETEGRRDWCDLRDDLIAVLGALDGPPAVLAGHSLGATVSLMTAAQAPGRVAGLVLFEPVVLPPGVDGVPEGSPLYMITQARRSTFASRDQALAAYTGKGAFRSWPAAMLADYVSAAFLDTPEGDVRLACSPQWELSNYRSQAHDVRRDLHRSQCTVEVLKGETHSTCGLTQAEADRLAPGRTRVKTIAGATHFLPMERLDLAREALCAAMEAVR